MRYERSIEAIDETAFASSLRTAMPAALRVAAMVLGTAEGADDVVQIAMERAWRARAAYDAARPFRPWFLRIVANTARNDRRHRGRRGALALRAAAQGESPATTPEEAAVGAADRAAVLAALNRLRGDDREVLALRYVEQLSETDVAAVLDCPVGTVKSRLARAKDRLRRQLEAGGRQEER